MPNTDSIRWFKQEFKQEIDAAAGGTPFTLDMLTALACQETGYVWGTLRKKGLTRARILELCVGDTLDSSAGRKAFPKTKSELVARNNGQEMFDIARQALVDMAKYIQDYKGAAANPNKFCHGFGIFQYDLQFFLTEPDYFLQRRYADFGACLAKCLEELRKKLRKLGWENKTSLTDYEMACVAIAYNTGRFVPSKGLKQGYKPKGGKYYGEQFFDFLRLAHTVSVSADQPSPQPPPQPGTAPLPPPTPIASDGKVYEVDVRSSPLRLRSEPEINKAQPNKNVVGRLPDGQLVRAVTNKKVNGFLNVETSLNGAHLEGWASAEYLKAVAGADAIPVVTPVAEPLPASPIVAVYMPRKSGTVTKRTEIAGSHSLNENGQPGRVGTTPDELRSEIARIIDWLAVDKKSHLRYQPRDGLTFCNIYAHDFCHLAGVYLPRIFWTPGAIEDLTLGKAVPILYGKTIEEVRANGLFRWLRDFGLRFGWRQTGTLTKLQTEVNQGAIGLIVARRVEDGRSGHIVMVVPETENERARRNSEGDVIAPLQSQAGVTNFRYGTSKLDWWKDAKFAESSFWLHA